MSDRFKITEMKLSGGQWHVSFEAPHNWAGYGSPHVSVDAEEEIPQSAPHELTTSEVIAAAHKKLGNELYLLFKKAVMSVPGVDWEIVRELTASELRAQIGGDDES